MLLLHRWYRVGLLLAALAGLLSSGLAQARPVSTPQEPAQAGAYSVFLPLVQGGAGAPAQSSHALIDAAMRRGELSQEAALINHIFADFNDPRLPATYQGAPSGGASPYLEAVAHNWVRLSPTAQATLSPFLLPPSAPGSWEELQGTQQIQLAAQGGTPRWATTCQASDRIKVWYHPYYTGDAEWARTICERVNGLIWQELVIDQMGRGPRNDTDETNNGGDGRFDIYLVSARSNTIGYRTELENAPAYMLVDRSGVSDGLLAELVMRAILKGYDWASYEEYAWFYHATAVWARDRVFPGGQEEHVMAPGYLEDAARELYAASLDLAGMWIPIDADKATIEEGAYLWPFYIARIAGRPEAIRTIWERSGEPDSLALINELVPFATHFPEFARLNWNRDPVFDYQREDLLPHGLKPLLDREITIVEESQETIDFVGGVRPLAMHSFRFRFPDMSVRSLAFVNRYTGRDLQTSNITVLLKIGGAWKEDNWTQPGMYSYCRDFLAERVEELVIIITNHDYQDRSHILDSAAGPQLHATNIGCRGWEVEAEATSIHTGPTWKKTVTVKTGAVFMRVPQPAQRANGDQYKLVAGIAEWHYAGSRGACTADQRGSYGVSNPALPFEMMVENYNVGYLPPFELDTRRYEASASIPRNEPMPVVTYICPTSTFKEPVPLGNWLQTSAATYFEKAIGENGHTIMDKLALPPRPGSGGTGTIVETFSWTMTALPPE